MNTDKQERDQPIEPKHLADDTSGRQEPSAHPKREPQHEPGFEAKHKAEAEKSDPNRARQGRSQADEATAGNQAHDDLKAAHDQRGQRARPAARKPDVKRGKVRKRK